MKKNRIHCFCYSITEMASCQNRFICDRKIRTSVKSFVKEKKQEESVKK